MAETTPKRLKPTPVPKLPWDASNLCNLPPKVRAAAERLRARYQKQLQIMTPFEEWCKKRNLTAKEITMYGDIRRELERESVCPSPRWFTIENGRLVAFGY